MTFHPKRFDRAAKTYGGLSQVQATMADTLLAQLPPSASPALSSGAGAPRILEMGCGTGHFTARLRSRFPSAFLLATDAAPGMLRETAARVPDAALARFDAEGPDERVPDAVRAAGPFDLAASNALVQWFPDLGAHLEMVAARLVPDGLLLVSGFHQDNFPELNAILAEEPFGHRDFPGHSREAIAAAAEGHFKVESLVSESVEEIFPDAGAFLSRIKGLGSARRPVEGSPMTRGRLELLLRRYQEGYPARGPGRTGIRATWKPWYALLRRR